jgi:hypothetical protein
MSTYIAVRDEAFSEARSAMKVTMKAENRYDSVRRPLRGFQERKDTYCVLKVITEGGYEIPLIDSGGTPQFMDGTVQPIGTGKAYSNFFIQQWQRGAAEKSQIVQTFGDTFVHFYGSNPVLIRFSGLLMNTVDFDWKREWWENYDRYLRGSRLVENKARLYFYVADYIYEGYLMSSNTTDVSNERHLVAFSGNFLVTDITPIRIIGSDSFPCNGIVQPDPRSRSSLGQVIVGSSSTEVAKNRTKYSYNYDEYIGTSDYWRDNPVGVNKMELKKGDIETNVSAVLKAYGFSNDVVSKVLSDRGSFVRTGQKANQ